MRLMRAPFPDLHLAGGSAAPGNGIQ